MTLFVVGVSYHRTALSIRERLAVPAWGMREALESFQRAAELREIAILSTCNRFELYGVGARERAKDLLALLAERSDSPSLKARGYVLVGEDAVRHLLRVTSGLESMVLGETDIIQQVKQAYQQACECRTAGPTLNRLFQKALHTSKLARTRTQISCGKTSVAALVGSAITAHCSEAIGSLQVLMWGAGKMGVATAHYLLDCGVRRIWVVNRTADRSKDLAAACQGQWLAWEQAIKHLQHVDVAVVSTQAPHYLISVEDVSDMLPKRGGRPLLLVDLSVPRNIDPSLRALPSVTVIDMDDLERMAGRGRESRRHEAARCEEIIDRQVGLFSEWLKDADGGRDMRGATDKKSELTAILPVMTNVW